MNPEAVTFWIAVWGALLGTISLGWNIYQAVSDRGTLRVRCKIGRFVIVSITTLPGGDRPTEPQLAYTITNVGRRAIVVSHIGGVYADGTSFEVVPRSTFPKELRPGENISERAEDPVTILLRNGSAKFVGAWDTTGKSYGIRRRELQELIAEARRLRAGTAGATKEASR